MTSISTDDLQFNTLSLSLCMLNYIPVMLAPSKYPPPTRWGDDAKGYDRPYYAQCYNADCDQEDCFEAGGERGGERGVGTLHWQWAECWCARLWLLGVCTAGFLGAGLKCVRDG